jgi:hypothetical protein
MTFGPRSLTAQATRDIRLAVKVDQLCGPGFGGREAVILATGYASTYPTRRVWRTWDRRTQVADDQVGQPLEGCFCLSGGVSGGT